MGILSSMNETFPYHERVGRVRAHFALSQTVMAQRVGLSLRAYQNYERGEREVPVALVHALYETF
ncbi:MAG: helix-turn-helix domain-containing protein, partial [Acidiferrobacterales bacterium]